MRLATKRSGFTLVEVLAAIVIGAVLLAAVYSTLEIMLRSIRIGKEAVQSLQVIRGTAIRLQTDIRQNLSLLMTAPSVQQALATANASSGSSSGSGSGTGGGTGSGSGGAGSTASTVDPVQFNFGVQGDLYNLTIYGSQTPHYSKIDAETPNSVFSDLRTITYYCDPTQGLMRQETINVLGGTNTDPSQQQEEAIAGEVKSMQFQYFDPVAQTWVTQWDGTNSGPPSAIEVTLTVQMPDIPGVPTKDPISHRLVIAIPTFGFPIPSTTGTTTQ